MIEILIFWLIAGILLIVLSGLSYYYKILGLIGFSVIFLLGIVILLLSTYHLWESKRKPSGKINPDTLKNMFTLFLIISVVIFALGGLGYLFNEFDLYKFDPETKSNLVAFIIIGLVTTIGCILSWIYVERSIPKELEIALMKQQQILHRIKSDSEEIGNDMKSRDKDVKDLLEDSAKIAEKNRIEMTRR